MNHLFQRIESWANREPARIALRDGLREIRYLDLWQQIQELARDLQAAGIRRLALRLDNSLEWALADLACGLADIVVIPVPTFFSDQQQAWLLDSSGADALIGATPAGWHETTLAGLPLARHQPQTIAPLPAGTAKITYTSGTTGQPKGVCLSLDQQVRTCEALAQRIAPARVEQHLTLLPLSTLLENLTGLYVPLLLGATSTIPSLAEVGFSGSSKLDPQRLAATILRHQPHSLVLVPELLRLVTALCENQPEIGCNLRFVAVGGGKVSPESIRHAKALGLPVFEGYGLSECGSVVALNTPDDETIGSVGRPLPHLAVRIAPNGEILVRGAAMLGYLGETETAPQEIATGDLGHLDAAGFLHVTGRKKNVQITAFGRNFSPEWIESEAEHCPAIARVVIFGDGLAQNVALIEPRPSTEAQLAEQIVALNKRLPDYARVHRWFVPEQPLSASGLLTPNGRPRRERILQTFATRIQQLAQGEPA